MAFPVQRMRRLRSNDTIRRMVRETRLTVDDLIYPLFIVFGQNKKIPVGSMPGVYQFSCDLLSDEVREIEELGIPGVLLFGIPENKDSLATASYDDHGEVQEAIRIIKDVCPELMVITDVCLCEYMDHGHCGVVAENGEINNDSTLELLAREALSHARAGADMVAPSDMMDGRVGYLRQALDENGFSHTAIMSYAAKYASAFYGPFREAADSTPQFGDRKTYQMDPANRREAMREIELDIAEGADIIMVKPALAYLDIIAEARERFDHPLAAYNVSGEYAMIKAAGASNWIDEERVMMETMTSIKRAGAEIIITYFAKDVARMLSQG